MRGIGKITHRPAGVVEPWSHEESFADASHAITFPPAAILELIREHDINVEMIRKRAWQALRGSSALLDFDIGFQISPKSNLGGKHRKYVCPESMIIRTVGALAALPTRIRRDPTGRTYRLINVGRPLSERYSVSTSRANYARNLVGPGRVVAVVEAPGVHVNGHNDSLPHHRALTLGRVSITSLDISVPSGGTLRTHVLWTASRSTADRKRIRELRIHLLRLHSIYELMRFLASPGIASAEVLIADTRDRRAFDRLQQTLLECVRTVRPAAPFRFGDSDQLLDTALFARRLVDVNLENMLTRMLATARPKVRTAVQEWLVRERMSEAVIAGNFRGDIRMSGDTYNVGNAGIVGANTYVEGNVVVGSDSTVMIAGKPFSSTELAEQLRKLLRHIEGVVGTEDQAEDVDRSAAELQEAAKRAESRDSHGVISALSRVGGWVLDAASQIGVPVAVAALKAAAGIA